MKNIWIIAENLADAARLIAGAKNLAAQTTVTAFVQGDATQAAPACMHGADRAFAMPLPAGAMWEQSYLAALVEKALAEKPQLILLSTSKRCRDLAAQMAAKLDAPCISDARQLALTETGATAETMVYGGLASRKVSTTAPTVLATVSAQAYEAAAPDVAKQGEMTVLPSAASAVKVTARRPKEAKSVNLADAGIVVGVGRGFADESELAIAKALAGKLNAEVACTRPIAEFFKWLPEECYLGVSGQVIKPKLYIALGVSGQAQHYYGVRDARAIVSVNKDPEALMNQQADYYIVGDLKEVVPLLTQALPA